MQILLRLGEPSWLGDLRIECSGWVAAEEGEEQASELARRWGAETQKAGGTQEAGGTQKAGPSAEY